MPLRRTTSPTARPARSSGRTPLSAPAYRPMGVRTASTITASRWAIMPPELSVRRARLAGTASEPPEACRVVSRDYSSRATDRGWLAVGVLEEPAPGLAAESPGQDHLAE